MMGEPVSFWAQLRLLLWRNGLIKRRAVRDTLREVLFPAVFFLFLVLIKSQNPPHHTDAVTDQRTDAAGLGDFMRPPHGHPRELLYAPAGGRGVEDVMDELRAALPEADRSLVVPFNTTDELESYFLAHPFRAVAGVEWTNATANAYAVRVNGSLVPGTADQLVPGPPAGFWEDDTTARDYVTSGFLAVQTAVNAAIISARGGFDGGGGGDGGIFALLFRLAPVPEAFTDPVRDVIVQVAPLYLVIGFFPVVQSLAQQLVMEKEKQTKIGLLMMGMRPGVLPLSWHITYSLITVGTSAIIAGLSSAIGFFEHTGFWPLFLVLVVYTQSVVALAFVISTMFDKHKTAAQAGGLVTLLLLAPKYAVHSGTAPGLVATLSLSSPVAFGVALSAMSDAEASDTGVGVNGNWCGGDETTFCFDTALFVLAIDTALYLVAGWYLDAVLRSEYGVSRPWYFCLAPGAARRRSDRGSADEVEASSVVSPQADGGVGGDDGGGGGGFVVRALRKVYGDGTAAVDGLDVDLPSAEITAVLGHNGSGKSTFISMLAGLRAPTSGRIELGGRPLDAATMTEYRRSLGVCPQHDVQFDHLTAREHLLLFGGLKGVPNVERAALESLDELGILDAKDKMSKEMSGGMRRKLSLAVALVGDPRVMLLDEVTAGCDPYSRTQLWKLIRSKRRADRVIILTTHFLDEAELLADRVAVLSHGRLRCPVSSPLALKAHFGLQYRLEVSPSSARADAAGVGSTVAGFDADKIVEAVARHVPGSSPVAAGGGGEPGAAAAAAAAKSGDGAVQAFSLPMDTAAAFPDLFAEIEADGAGYHLLLPSLEQVFMSLDKEDKEQRSAEGGSSGGDAAGEDDRLLPGSGSLGVSVSEQFDMPGEHDLLARRPGVAPPLMQLRAMVIKRAIVFKRNPRAVFFQFVFPLLYICVVLVITGNSGQSSLRQPPSLGLHAAAGGLADLSSPATMPLPWTGPDSAAPLFANAFGGVRNAAPLRCTDGITRCMLPRQTHALGTYAGVEVLQAAGLNGTAAAPRFNATLLYNQSAYHSAPAFAEAAANAVLREVAPDAPPIRGTDRPFVFVGKPEVASADVATAIVVALALSYVPLAVAIGAVRERESKAKDVQLLMTPVHVYWAGHYLFDVICFIVTAVAAVLLFVVVGSASLAGSSGTALGTFSLLMSFGVSSLALMYLVSLFFRNPTSVSAVLGMGFSFGAVALFIVMLSLDVGGGGSSLLTSTVAFVHPAFGLTWGLYQQARARASLSLSENSCAAGVGSECGDGAGADLGAVAWPMLASTAAWVAALMWVELRRRRWKVPGPLAASVEEAAARRADGFDPASEDADVAAERRRVEDEAEPGGAGAVEVRGLYKGYGGAPVVRGLSFAVQRGEILIVLGPNGAGKSTALDLAVPATAGDVHLNGHSVTHDQDAALASLGFSPQFDGLVEQLTCDEHLELFARLRGVPDGPAMRRAVGSLMRALRLDAFADTQARNLSGGNKRKLSFALSVVGSPDAALILDECTSGVDVVSRRSMWDVLTSLKAGRAVVWSTHLMEEACAVGDRIAIVVRGRLVAFGTQRRLAARHGQGFEVRLRLDSRSEDARAAAVAYVRERMQCPDAEVTESFGSSVRMTVQRLGGDMPVSAAFRALEDARGSLGLREYSLCETSLEGIFISFARRQDLDSDHAAE